MLQTYILQFTHTHIREEKYLLRNLANECLIKVSLKALGELGKRLSCLGVCLVRLALLRIL